MPPKVKKTQSLQKEKATQTPRKYSGPEKGSEQAKEQMARVRQAHRFRKPCRHNLPFHNSDTLKKHVDRAASVRRWSTIVIALTMRISEVQQMRQEKQQQSDNSRRHMETIFGKAFD